MLMVNFQQGALSKSGIEKKKYDFSFFKSRKTIYNEHTLPEATLPFRGFLRILTIGNKLLSEDTFSQDLQMFSIMEEYLCLFSNISKSKVFPTSV